MKIKKPQSTNVKQQSNAECYYRSEIGNQSVEKEVENPLKVEVGNQSVEGKAKNQGKLENLRVEI